MEQQILTAYLCFWLAVFGAVLGSFLDCAASRWAAGDPRPFRGRSRCGSCGQTLGPRDLVPVFSFLLRRGRCRYCGARIPAECLVSELAGAAAFVCLGLRFGWSLELGQWLPFAALLLALSLTDRAKRVLPDKLLLLLAANRAVWFVLLGHGVRELLEAGKACAVPAALLALVLAMERLLGREAMGGGDIKLLFVLALYLGWAELFLTLLAGCLLGLLWAALTGGNGKTAMPFGPFLALGAMLTVCCGGPVLEWYFGLF
nr:prepilin peptidase [uncultured Oscillibacter sp.]